MIALSLKDVTKSFGAEDVLKGVTLTLTDQMRLGLIGQNGAGKTTLLRLIAGIDTADGGSVSLPTAAGYLPQEVPAGTQQSVWETMLSVFEDAFALEARMRTLEQNMQSAADDETAWQRLSREYEQVTGAFEEAGGYGYKSAINGVLDGLGLGEPFYDRAVNTLSGGERSRLMLAKLLLEKPSLLLLDEPTNHLDTDAIVWLENYLKSWQGAVVIVSHDRWLLDQLCTHIAELRSGIVQTYTGNYSDFVKQKQEMLLLAEKAYAHNQREIARQEKVIEQYRVWGRAGGGKNFIKAQARQTLLNKMERLERPESASARISLRLDAHTRSGNDVLFLRGITKAFNGQPPLFSDIAIDLRKGERAALMGPNGAGKTTLLHIAAQTQLPDTGTVQYGVGVSMGLYDQLQQSLSPNNTVIEEMRENFPALSDSMLRNTLASFLFCGDDVFKRISALSGGEKGRLSLLKLMLGGHNLLLLDEPTNHLDMESREMLEDALCHFEGTVLFVSHDRYFINKTATRVLELKSGTLSGYQGGFEDYMRALAQKQQPQTQPSGITKTAEVKQKKADKQMQQAVREAKRRAKQLEEDIQKAEQRLADIEAQLADPAHLDAAQLTLLSQQHEDLQHEIESMMHAWEMAHSEC